MILKYSLSVLVSFAGGVVTGGALAAFATMLEIVPRLLQITETNNKVKIYQNVFAIGSIIFIAIYFSDFYINLGKILVIIVGLIMGTFIGLFSSALAEVLNVIPVISKKFKIKDYLQYTIYSLLAGKVIGSLYFFINHK